MFAIFVSAIFSVIINALPILVAAMAAMVVLTVAASSIRVWVNELPIA